jgi:hypothetical protein
MHQLTGSILALLTLVGGTALAGDQWTHSPEDDRIGRIYYYERSNVDGSLDERVTVFRRSTTALEVYKENGLCGNAALVTADLDSATLSAPRITGGSLRPNAEHVEFAFLTTNAEADAVDMLVRLPDMEIRDQATIRSPHWHLYDFDLASLTVATPHIDSRRDGFDFGLMLLWADPNGDDPLFWLGEVEARYVALEERLGVRSERYELGGSAFEGANSTGPSGTLWLDAAEGHVVDAIMPVPNHPGYTDFRLRLLRISDGGEAEWRTLLTAHFADCPDRAP